MYWRAEPSMVRVLLSGLLLLLGVDQLGRRAPRPRVAGERLLHVRRLRQGEPRERVRDHGRDVEEADAAAEERGDGHLVGSVEDSRGGPAGAQGGAGERQRGEALVVRALEVEPGARGEVEAGCGRAQAG